MTPKKTRDKATRAPEAIALDIADLHLDQLRGGRDY